MSGIILGLELNHQERVLCVCVLGGEGGGITCALVIMFLDCQVTRHVCDSVLGTVGLASIFSLSYLIRVCFGVISEFTFCKWSQGEELLWGNNLYSLPVQLYTTYC